MEADTDKSLWDICESVLKESGRISKHTPNMIAINNRLTNVAEMMCPEADRKTLENLNRRLEKVKAFIKEHPDAIGDPDADESVEAVKNVLRTADTGLYRFLAGECALDVFHFPMSVPIETEPGTFENARLEIAFGVATDSFMKRKYRNFTTGAGAYAKTLLPAEEARRGYNAFVCFNVSSSTDLLDEVISKILFDDPEHLKFGQMDDDHDIVAHLFKIVKDEYIVLQRTDPRRMVHELGHVVDHYWKSRRSMMDSSPNVPYFSKATEVNSRWQELLLRLRQIVGRDQENGGNPVYTASTIAKTPEYRNLVHGVTPDQRRRIAGRLPEIVDWMNRMASR